MNPKPERPPRKAIFKETLEERLEFAQKFYKRRKELKLPWCIFKALYILPHNIKYGKIPLKRLRPKLEAIMGKID